MKSYDVVGYTGDADSYCPPCAKMRYGDDLFNRIDIKDREGNFVGPIFADSEWDYPITCSDCHEYIDTNLTSDGIAYAVNMVEEAFEKKHVTSFLLEVADNLMWMKLDKDMARDHELGNMLVAYIEMGYVTHE